MIRGVRVTELSGPGTVYRHRANDARLIWAKRVGMPRPYAVSFVRDGALLACTSSPHQVRRACSVWDRDGERKNAFDACWAIASPDGRQLARAWDGGFLNVAGAFRSPEKDFGSTSQGVPAAFSPDGERLGTSASRTCPPFT